MIRKLGIFLGAAILSLFPLQSGLAAGEMELQWQKQFTSMQPIFMEGHEGDMNAVAGFQMEGDILMGDTVLGSVSTEWLFVNPPMNLTAPYSQAFMRVTNTLTGMGSFEVTGTGLSLGSSTTATAGDFVAGWVGSISNGTGSLTDIYGLSSGISTGSVFAGQSESTETLRIRFGF